MLSSQTEYPRSIDQPGPGPAADDETRRIQRISLPLPVRVEVMIDPSAQWNEITRLLDVSAFGAGFMLKRPLKRGRLVLLTVPMPRQLRSYDFSEPQYKIWALVRRCIPVESPTQENEFSVGVAFIGKSPPSGYLENPATLYDISTRTKEGWHLIPADLMADESDLPIQLRKQSRFHIPEELMLQKIDSAGEVLKEELTVTENISIGGAAVFTTIDTEVGSFFRVRSERFGVTILSIVRTKRIGKDGVTRLHLEFVDRLFPLEGIS